MFIDASALVAILTQEREADAFVERLQKTDIRLTSPIAVWETAVAISRILALKVEDASSVVKAYLDEIQIRIIAVEPETAVLALQAFDRYGKGRHPAKLNFGDCFSYACAKVLNQPLLYKGDDFAQTDIETA
ncbi:MAG: type II toxin-antitoxin system VapC family toxin [Rhizobiaceae bacterium]